MEKLSESQIQTALKAAPEWSELNGAIQRTYHFANFVEAMMFVNQVAEQAERDQHHPDVLIRYNKVTLTLSTHDSGGITSKDFDLAAKADRMAPPPPKVEPKSGVAPASISGAVKAPAKKAKKG